MICGKTHQCEKSVTQKCRYLALHRNRIQGQLAGQMSIFDICLRFRGIHRCERHDQRLRKRADCSTYNVFSCRSIIAMPRNDKGLDAAALSTFYSNPRHSVRLQPCNGYRHLGIGLTMAHAATIVGFGFILEDTNLLVFTLLLNTTRNTDLL